MKKPIIKNWIKYWSSAIAVSGLLVVGTSCGDSNQTAENEAERAETEVAAPVRENVAETTQEAETETEEIPAQEESNLEFERTSNTQSGSNDMNASGISDMDAHIEEHKEVNERIKEELTNANSQNSQLQQETSSDQQERSQYGQDGNVNQTRGEDQRQEMQPDQNQYTPQSNTTPDQSADQTMQQENMNQNQQDLQGNEQQTGTVEYGTDSQGNTEMEMNQNQDSQSNDTTPYLNQNNSQGETDLSQQQQQTTEQQESPNTYDRQSNTDVNESADLYLIIMESQQSAMDEESSKKYEEVMNEYKARRQNMAGQINDETGAYIAPETDPMPKKGAEQLLEQIQENIEYPQNALAAEIQGTVFVNFIVDENGNVTEAKAVEDVIVPVSSMTTATTPLDPTKFSEAEIEEAKKEMMKEAVKAVEKTSGEWTPAMHEQQNVKAELQLPVIFDIERTGGGTTTDPVNPQE